MHALRNKRLVGATVDSAGIAAGRAGAGGGVTMNDVTVAVKCARDESLSLLSAAVATQRACELVLMFAAESAVLEADLVGALKDDLRALNDGHDLHTAVHNATNALSRVMQELPVGLSQSGIAADITRSRARAARSGLSSTTAAATAVAPLDSWDAVCGHIRCTGPGASDTACNVCTGVHRGGTCPLQAVVSLATVLSHVVAGPTRLYATDDGSAFAATMEVAIRDEAPVRCGAVCVPSVARGGDNSAWSHVWVLCALPAGDDVGDCRRDGATSVHEVLHNIRKSIVSLTEAGALLFRHAVGKYAMQPGGAEEMEGKQDHYPLPWLGGKWQACRQLLAMFGEDCDSDYESDLDDAIDAVHEESKHPPCDLLGYGVQYKDMSNTCQWATLFVQAWTVREVRKVQCGSNLPPCSKDQWPCCPIGLPYGRTSLSDLVMFDHDAAQWKYGCVESRGLHFESEGRS